MLASVVVADPKGVTDKEEGGHATALLLYHPSFGQSLAPSLLGPQLGDDIAKSLQMM